MARLVLVDSDVSRRSVLAATLAENGYGSVLGYDRVDATEVAGSVGTADLVLLDLDEGRDTAPVDALTRGTKSSAVAILGLTSDASAEGRVRAARSGVADFAVRPVGEAELCLRIDTALHVERLERLVGSEPPALPLDPAFGESGPTVVQESLWMLAAVAGFHDDDTSQHAPRVGLIAAALARALDCPTPFATMLQAAAPLHDIGKVGISRRILLKPDKLTPPEWLHMMSHVDIGAQILGSAQSPVFELAAEIARTHHERWDGSGYTEGLAGEEIPLSGRIVAVADVWDTLTHQRPYRSAWPPERAFAEILAQSGSHFDPDVVTAFASLDAQDLPVADEAIEHATA